MRRLAVAAVVVLALAALLAWLARGGGRSTHETPSPAPSATPAGLPLRTPPEPRSAPEVTHEPPPTTRDRAAAEETAPEARVAPPRVLTGTIVAIDSTGGEHRDEDGLLVFELGSHDHCEIEVLHGRFRASSVELQGGETLRVLPCSLGDRLALPDSATPVTIPADGPVELRVRWRTKLLLHVRARDGGELEDVFVFDPPLTAWAPGIDTHPGPRVHEFERAAGRSPVHFDLGDGSWLQPRVVYVRSRGYAWGRIELDPVEHEEQTLVLDPGGELELQLDGDASGMKLVLLSTDAEPAREVLTWPMLLRSDRELLFEGLPAGGYAVQVLSDGRPIGEASLEIAAGERARATLRLGAWSSTRVPLEGVLVLPEGCEHVHVGVYFSREGVEGNDVSFFFGPDDMTIEPDSSERIRWSVPSVPVGRYEVVVLCADSPILCDFKTRLDTGRTGIHDALIEVPASTLFSLRCVDERTGSTVQSEEPVAVTFTPAAHRWYPADSRDGRWPSPWESRLPQSQVLFSTSPNLYEPAARIVTLGPGKNEIVLRLRRKL